MYRVIELIFMTGNYSFPLVAKEVYNFYNNYGIDHE